MERDSKSQHRKITFVLQCIAELSNNRLEYYYVTGERLVIFNKKLNKLLIMMQVFALGTYKLFKKKLK